MDSGLQLKDAHHNNFDLNGTREQEEEEEEEEKSRILKFRHFDFIILNL